MSDYKVGYGRPPREYQFRKGVCPNPSGRGKRKAFSIGAVTRDILSQQVTILERGRSTRIRRFDALIRKSIADAVKGDVRSAEIVLKLRNFAKRHPSDEAITISVSGGLPNSKSNVR